MGCRDMLLNFMNRIRAASREDLPLIFKLASSAMCPLLPRSEQFPIMDGHGLLKRGDNLGPGKLREQSRSAGKGERQMEPAENDEKYYR